MNHGRATRRVIGYRAAVLTTLAVAVAQPGFAVDRTELTAEVANLRAAPPPTAQAVPLTVEATNSGEVDSPETTNPPLVPATSTGNDPQGALDPR